MTGLGWFKLLRAHQRRNGQGLTVPFLIGATRNPIGTSKQGAESNYKDLIDLLRSMRDDAPDGVWTRIAECPDLGQPVVYLRSTFYVPEEADCRVLSPEHGRLSLVAQSNYISEPSLGIESLAQYLWQRFGQAMLAGRLSFVRSTRSFICFSDADVRFVEDADGDEDDSD